MIDALKLPISLRTGFILCGLAVVSGAAFVIGPLISIGGADPFSSLAGRIGFAALAPGIYGVTRLVESWRTFRQNAAMLDSAVRPEADAAGGAEYAHESAEIAQRLREALSVLRKRRFPGAAGKRWLYQIPWYVIIGPPGSGKTTALVNAGLSFPLADRFGRNAMRGIGGTRSCDWWFTDEAVLIDTAGRYTTQDSDAGKDHAAWLGFLRLLRRYRRRQPLNGLLVAIAVDEVTEGREEARLAHARLIRRRIQEVQAELRIRLPVYLLLTKADLISGFTEFFDDLGREGRQSVWGFTFDLDGDRQEDGKDDRGVAPVDRFGGAFDALVGRLDERLIDRLHQERDGARRNAVYSFPHQVASIKDALTQFVEEAFRPNSFEQEIMLRGAYFLSGTQVGTPIDRVLAAMRRSFGIGPQPKAAGIQPKRSYFLTRLLREVVFGEAGLANADPRIERNRRRIAWSLHGAIAVLCVAAAGVAGIGYMLNRTLIEKVEAAAGDYALKAREMDLDQVGDFDLARVLPLLNEVRDIPTGYAERDLPRSWLAGLGLDQTEKLGSQTVGAYRRILGSVLLPRLILRLEDQLRKRPDEPEFLHQALKAYLMLGGQGPMDRAFVERWFEFELRASYPDQQDARLRQDLGGHIKALLERPLPQVGLDGDLVSQLRAVLKQTSLAKQTLDAIAAGPEAAALPGWTIADHAGPAGTWVFHRASGLPLADGIPGLYTRDGFFRTFLPLLPHYAETMRQEAWVLGSGPVKMSPEAEAEHERDTVGLYLQAFALRWDRLLGDVAVNSAKSYDDALRTLSILSSPTSPIRLLVVSAGTETRLAQPAGDAAPPNRQAMADEKLAKLLLRQRNPDSIAALAERFSAEHFRELHALSMVPPGSSASAQPRIDEVIVSLGNLYRSLNQARFGGTSSGDARGDGQITPLQDSVDGAAALAEIDAQAASLPAPVRNWITGISRTSSSMSSDGVRQRLTDAWLGNGGRFCAQATAGRYPFDRTGTDEISLEDFARLFAKGGLIDSFFEQNLASFVDKSAQPWRWRKLGPVDLKLSRESLAQFERAALIRDSMFPPGSTRPEAGFRLTLVRTSFGTSGIDVSVGGRTASLAPGSAQSAQLSWPGNDPATGTSVTFKSGLPNSRPTAIVIDGPWSLFRLLDRSLLQADAATRDRLTVRIASGPAEVDLLLQESSLANPFGANPVSAFRCPRTL
ncbi:type VI secretion system membrane subunit TssM (plasmid) [Skermanella rosea]|uniref:type VI secretion system membrane subunit TssM n=1 Tax=Skermanella rosea TaxID=1817965 RepID=UPI001931B40C|nr:type VI secretion system membrane subunit TssM [Skermanella rosea]UEM07589.1 type VI secretion system membrane subunit TssM [Skermanella rosea]